MKLMEDITRILTDYTPHQIENWRDVPLLVNISHKIARNQALTFLLPAFPAKSPSPQKTSGQLPDMGEVLALKNLQQLCERLHEVYEQKVELVICSDGRVFSDIVGVDDATIDQYNQGIQEIISEFNLFHLRTFSMDDIFPDLTENELRELLLQKYAKGAEQIRELVLSDQNTRSLLNGVHRFLLEDERALRPLESRNQVAKKVKKSAYELLRRSDAWSELLNEYFQNELRLSIHPYPLGHEKFGIKLVASSNKWATPWHNVVVQIEDRFELMHLKDAQKLKAQTFFHQEKYAYFKVANIL